MIHCGWTLFQVATTCISLWLEFHTFILSILKWCCHSTVCKIFYPCSKILRTLKNCLKMFWNLNKQGWLEGLACCDGFQSSACPTREHQLRYSENLTIFHDQCVTVDSAFGTYINQIIRVMYLDQTLRYFASIVLCKTDTFLHSPVCASAIL